MTQTTRKDEIQIEQRAQDPRAGLTLGELAQFVQEAYRANVPEDTKVEQTANWTSGIKRVRLVHHTSHQA